MIRKILIVGNQNLPLQKLTALFGQDKILHTEKIQWDDLQDSSKNWMIDLIVLGMEAEEGRPVRLIREIRRRGNPVPILVLSREYKKEEYIACLLDGADDYMSSTIQAEILLHRVVSLIRRNKIYSKQKIQNEVYAIGDFYFDMDRLECYKVGSLIPFTGKEFVLFYFFAKHPGQIFTKEELYHRVWNENLVDDNTIMVYIKRIREKLGDSPRKPTYIKNMWGKGYVFNASSDDCPIT